MNDYNVVGLYDHNAESYNKIKEAFKQNKEVAIVHATGTGKSFNAIQYAYDNKDKKIIYVVPYNPIIEHLNKIIEDNPNLTEYDFKHVEFRTYTSFINMSSEELENLEVDTLILDEFHHIGAPIWGARIQSIIDTHPNLNILGMTAYTVRDRGTSYERDMANPEGGELFSNKVASNYDLCDAMIDGVLPKPIYKSAYVNLEGTYEYLEKKVNSLDHESKDYQELSKLMNDIKKRIHEAPSMTDVFKNNIKKDGKYIYFCPLNSEEGINDIDTIENEVKEWLKQMGLSEDDYVLYTTTSQMGEDGKKNRDAFYNDKDLNDESANNKLRIMFAINQYNEGTHVPNIDGVIMGRTTQSDIIFFEQLGRALAVRGRTKEVFDHYESKSIDELKELCNKRNIDINDNLSKSDLIELLVAPTVIDLANNIEFIKDLENNLKDRLKLIQGDGLGNKRISHITNANFDIEMLNQNIFEIIKYMQDRLTMTWEDKYELAKAYYEHHGNLEVPDNFKTINGYEFDENGEKLGKWIGQQRQAYKGKQKITPERIKKLEEIGMIWDLTKDKWMNNYNLAKIYYEHHGNLEMPQNFKTINGYEFDEKGIKLGGWITTQRQAYKGNKLKLTQEQIKLLEKIGIKWNLKTDKWMNNYNLAKAYYAHYGNLEILQNFKTINGYEYDEKGIKLGSWINAQRQAYKGNKGKLTKEKIELLKEIGMRFETNFDESKWLQMYDLAKAYYEHHGNLEIPKGFKTINGYEFDEKGFPLGNWLGTQRQTYKGKTTSKLNSDQIRLLGNIGIAWDLITDKWMSNYNLAKAYYEHHGNLEIPNNFKTINGYEYDEHGVNLRAWLSGLKQAYEGKSNLKITEDRIKLLEKIGIKWFTDTIDDKLQKEEIIDDEKKKLQKQKELLNRTYSLISKYDDKFLPSKEEINQDFMDQLNRKR